MEKKMQFQNLAIQQTLRHYSVSAPTVIQPSITLPVRRELFAPSAPPLLPAPGQETLATDEPAAEGEKPDEQTQAANLRKQKLLRGLALLLSLFLGLTVYFAWRAMNANAAPPAMLQQNYSGASITSTASDEGSTTTSTSMIQVYILGAVKNPGVYSLPANARIYQLVQAAGGLLPNANMVALNMAARLSDGEEVYVLTVGEQAPPGTSYPAASGNGTPGAITPGQLVNINTATETEMRQVLHVSAATAQKIIAYRTQHGPYTSVEQLLQVVSQAIYQHIKDMVTV